jgi:HEAT repeat protein
MTPVRPALAALALLAACGGSPAVRSTDAALDRGDVAGATTAAGEDRAALALVATEVLARGLAVEAPEVQIAAIRAIARQEIEELGGEVALRMGSPDPRVQAEAAAAVLRAHPDAPHICTALLESEVAEARAACVEAIGRKVGAPARAELVPRLADEAPAVRRAAIVAVAALGDAADRARLGELAASDPDPGCRAAALRGLGRHAPAAAVRAALAADALALRLAGVDALVAIGDRAGLDAAIAGDDLPVALAAAAARYRADGTTGRATLERGLAAQAWTVRVAALTRATSAAPRGELPTLAGRAIVDPVREVRLAAARLLLRLGQRARAIAELRAALALPDVALDAAADLARLGEADGVAWIARALGDADPATRTAAIAAHATARRLTPALRAALHDADPLVALAAAELVLELTRS